MYNISETIRLLIAKKNITKKEIAEKAGFIPASVSRMINNNNNNYDINTIYRLFSALNCDIEIVIKDSDTQKVLYTLQHEADEI